MKNKLSIYSKLIICQFLLLFLITEVNAQIKTCVPNPTYITATTMSGTYTGQKLFIVNDVTLTANTTFTNCEINIGINKRITIEY